MTRARLEAFSDGVIAILITIMILELKIPHGSDLAALRAILPEFLTYVLSFTFLGIYWTNHHHMFHVVEHVTGAILWSNLHLLFWLSLVPFATAWVGTNPLAPLPTATYGVVLFLAALSWLVLQKAIIAHHGPQSKLAQAVGKDVKGKISQLMYAAAIPLAFIHPWISDAIYVTVALMWIVPDRRIESTVKD
jgi:uncharacterized membrane protein